MRYLFTLSFIVLVVGCSAVPQGEHTPIQVTPAPDVAFVGNMLTTTPTSPFDAIGAAVIDESGMAMTDKLILTTQDEVQLDPASIWLNEGSQLPAELITEASPSTRYAIVRAKGQLAEQGEYGPDGAYHYQLNAPNLEALSVRNITLKLLLENHTLYTNQALRLDGQLLISSETALLVERVGKGGIPDSNALQIKLTGPLNSTELQAQLQPAANEQIFFGPAQVVGVWRNGAFYPLVIQLH